MRIPSNVDAPERAAQADRALATVPSKAGKTASRGGGVATEGVKATVSAKARSLAAEHGLDIEKVHRLRELIDNGQFAMDFKLIAQRIVEGA
jgi:anti-sigma28 factor (negative regulator of flagellin synthesis)